MMTHSWRLLLLRSNSRNFLQKSTSFIYSKVQSSSFTSLFHLQSRTQHTETTKPRIPLNTYGSLDSKSLTSLDFLPADVVIKEKRVELEDLKAIAENRNAIEEERNELVEDSAPFQSSSSSSLFQTTQTRTQHTETTISRNSVYPYGSFESKSSISLDWSPADVVIEEKRDELEQDLKVIAEKRNAIEEEKRIDKEQTEKDRRREAEEIEETWDDNYTRAVHTLIEFSDEDDIKTNLNHQVVIDHDLIKNVLEGFESNPTVAKRFFYFMLDKDSNELDYTLYETLYNSMLCVFGVNRLFDEFWDLAKTMNAKRCLVSSSSCKEKRYLIDMNTWDKLSEYFREHGLVRELEKLNMFVLIQYIDNKMINIALLLSTIRIRLKDMIGVELSGYFVKFVLEHHHMCRNKELMFFWWIAENDHWRKCDEKTYSFIASVLGKEIDKYCKLVDYITRGRNHDMEVGNEVTEFYANALACSNTMPSVNCCVYLLMKLILCDHMLEWNGVNVEMIRVVDAFEKNGGILTDSDVSDVINSMLVSVNDMEVLDFLADVVISTQGSFKVQHLPRSNFNETGTERDRQRRAGLLFSALHKTTSAVE